MKPNPKCLICEICHQSFSRPYALRRHRSTIHERNTAWACQYCAKRFSEKYNLFRHIKLVHTFENDEGILYECDDCEKKFRKKSGLSRHINIAHATENMKEYVECHDCGKKLRSKLGLSFHISVAHMDNAATYYECHDCSQKFCSKAKMAAHINAIHMKKTVAGDYVRNKDLKCLLCDDIFRFKRAVRMHYEKVHQIALEWEQLYFDSFDEFKSWKKKMEHETVTHYRIRCVAKTTTHTSRLYHCHRSGTYNDACKNRKRKHLLKIFGSKKLQGCCPAELIVKIKHDGTCDVSFHKTHVGHPIGHEYELRHMYLDKEEKNEFAAARISEIQMHQVLLNSWRSSASIMSGDDDIYDIAANQNLSYRNVMLSAGDNELNVESFVERNKNSVIYCKFRGEIDDQYPYLKKKDFVIVIMSKMQEDSLRRYGYKVVSIDGTTKTTGFVLHTLLVLDVDREGIPAAFVLSNRNDQVIVDLFLSCLRDRIGIVSPQTIITDLSSIYIDSWMNWMPLPQQHLYCTWHVNKSWSENLNATVADATKRKEIRESLLELRAGMDVDKFEEELEEFISSLRADCDCKKFLEYFENNFMENRPQWAYCYRTYELINTDKSIEFFYRMFKRKTASKRKTKTLGQTLSFINDYLAFKANDLWLRDVRGKRTNKRVFLRKRHKIAEEEFERGTYVIVTTEDGVWFVDSVESEEDITKDLCMVEKLEIKECSLYDDLTCRLPCTECQTCYHQYRCNCSDYTIRQNMCKHIHLLGMYLLKHNDIEEIGISDDLDEYISVTGTDEYDEEICNEEMTSTCSTIESSNTSEVAELKEKYVSKFVDKVRTICDAVDTEEQFQILWELHIEPMTAALTAFKQEQ